MKKSSSMTATRTRFLVHADADRDRYGAWCVYRCSRKSAALRIAKKHQPADITDTMAKIGSQQVWRVTEGGMACIKRRMA